MIESVEGGVDRAGVLDQAEACYRAKIVADADQMMLAAAWADVNPPESIPPDQLDIPGGLRPVQPGADGTPSLTDGSIAEFGATQSQGFHAASALIGHALNLRHRLPKLWAKITTYEMPAWQGRKISEHTQRLTAVQAKWVDSQVAWCVGKVPWPVLEPQVKAAVMRVDRDRIEAEAAERRKQRGAWFSQTNEHGHKGLFARGEAHKMIKLEAEINRIAGLLPTTGAGEALSADERRFEALCLLADPLYAARLKAEHHQPDLFDQELAQEIDDRDGVEESEVHPSLRDRPATTADHDQAVFEEAVRRIVQDLDWEELLAPATLVVHVTWETLRDGHGICRVPDVGPATLGMVKDWLGHQHVDVKPVIDLNDPPPPASRYEISPKIREHVQLLYPTSMFPWSSAAKGLDLDHWQPYLPQHRGGPPGQTRVDGLVPLARPEHRVVTHAGWQRRQPEPGTMIFKTPHGRVYLTNYAGTHNLGNGPFAQTVWAASEPAK